MAKGKKKAQKAKKVHVKTGARNCHLKNTGSGLSLVCPGIKAIKIGYGFVGSKVRFASKRVAQKAAIAPPAQEVVVNSSGVAAPAIEVAEKPMILDSEYFPRERRRRKKK